MMNILADVIGFLYHCEIEHQQSDHDVWLY